jgi:hypothetical protein
MSDKKCPCGNKTTNILMCDNCIETSVPSYMLDENGKKMSVDELMENSIIPLE